MDRSNIAYLVRQTITYDEIGQMVVTEQNRRIYCNVATITRDEFYSAGEVGIRPKWKITTFEADYEYEEYCIYKNTKYHIYRAYVKSNEEIELYLENLVGVANG